MIVAFGVLACRGRTDLRGAARLDGLGRAARHRRLRERARLPRPDLGAALHDRDADRARLHARAGVRGDLRLLARRRPPRCRCAGSGRSRSWPASCSPGRDEAQVAAVGRAGRRDCRPAGPRGRSVLRGHDRRDPPRAVARGQRRRGPRAATLVTSLRGHAARLVCHGTTTRLPGSSSSRACSRRGCRRSSSPGR